MDIVGSFYWNTEDKTINHMIINRDNLSVKKQSKSIKIKDQDMIHAEIERFLGDLRKCSNEACLEFRTILDDLRAKEITKQVDAELKDCCHKLCLEYCNPKGQLKNFLMDKKKKKGYENDRTKFEHAIKDLYRKKGYAHNLKKEEFKLWEIALHTTHTNLPKCLKEIETKMH